MADQTRRRLAANAREQLAAVHAAGSAATAAAADRMLATRARLFRLATARAAT
jgi:hypothetical protein